MSAALSGLKSSLSSKAFLIGLAVIAVFYSALFGTLAMRGDSSLQALEETLASQTVSIQRQAAPEQSQESQEASHAQVTNTPRKGPGLTAAPVEGLFEKTALGPLPKMRRYDHLTPFKAYRRNFTFMNPNPLVAILVQDFGLSQKNSAVAIQSLPPEVSFLLSPYSSTIDEIRQSARADGHEIWLNLAMENMEFPDNDPGPKTIVTRASLNDNQDALNWTLSRTTGYVGVAVHVDEIFNAAQPMLQNLMNSVFSRGLGLVSMHPAAPGGLEALALNMDAPFIKTNVMLVTPDDFQLLESTAHTQGYALGIIAPYPGHLETLSAWVNTLDQKGLTLAPVSALAEAPVWQMQSASDEPAVTSEDKNTENDFTDR